jgi:hypothetical protein
VVIARRRVFQYSMRAGEAQCLNSRSLPFLHTFFPSRMSCHGSPSMSCWRSSGGCALLSCKALHCFANKSIEILSRAHRSSDSPGNASWCPLIHFMEVLIGSVWIFCLIAATRSKSLAEGDMGDDAPSACHRASWPSHPIVTCPSVILYWIHKSSRTHTIPYKPPNSLLL